MLCLVLQPGSHVRCKCKRMCECKDLHVWTTPTQMKMQMQASRHGMKNFSFSWACVCVCVCVCFPYVWTGPTKMQLGTQGEEHRFHQCMPSRHNSKKDDVDVLRHYGRKTWESVRKFPVSVIHGACASHFPCVCVGRNSLKFAFYIVVWTRGMDQHIQMNALGTSRQEKATKTTWDVTKDH